MKILIVLGHPDAGSLNHAVTAAVRDDMRDAWTEEAKLLCREALAEPSGTGSVR